VAAGEVKLHLINGEDTQQNLYFDRCCLAALAAASIAAEAFIANAPNADVAATVVVGNFC
jgi:hypothetical protein